METHAILTDFKEFRLWKVFFAFLFIIYCLKIGRRWLQLYSLVGLLVSVLRLAADQGRQFQISLFQELTNILDVSSIQPESQLIRPTSWNAVRIYSEAFVKYEKY